MQELLGLKDEAITGTLERAYFGQCVACSSKHLHQQQQSHQQTDQQQGQQRDLLSVVDAETHMQPQADESGRRYVVPLSLQCPGRARRDIEEKISCGDTLLTPLAKHFRLIAQRQLLQSSASRLEETEKDVDCLAMAMLFRSQAFSRLVSQLFPSAVLLSVHSSPNTGPKYSVALFLAAPQYSVAPYQCVPVTDSRDGTVWPLTRAQAYALREALSDAVRSSESIAPSVQELKALDTTSKAKDWRLDPSLSSSPLLPLLHKLKEDFTTASSHVNEGEGRVRFEVAESGWKSDHSVGEAVAEDTYSASSSRTTSNTDDDDDVLTRHGRVGFIIVRRTITQTTSPTSETT